MPFSDPSVLSGLICNRMALDKSYKEKIYPSGILSPTGGIVFNEQILSVYVDLDRLIEDCPLSKKQRAVIELLMRGYTIQDIAEETNRDHSNISHIYARALNALVETHNRRWQQVMNKRRNRED